MELRLSKKKVVDGDAMKRGSLDGDIYPLAVIMPADHVSRSILIRHVRISTI